MCNSKSLSIEKSINITPSVDLMSTALTSSMSEAYLIGHLDPWCPSNLYSRLKLMDNEVESRSWVEVKTRSATEFILTECSIGNLQKIPDIFWQLLPANVVAQELPHTHYQHPVIAGISPAEDWKRDDIVIVLDNGKWTGKKIGKYMGKHLPMMKPHDTSVISSNYKKLSSNMKVEIAETSADIAKVYRLSGELRSSIELPARSCMGGDPGNQYAWGEYFDTEFYAPAMAYGRYEKQDINDPVPERDTGIHAAFIRSDKDVVVARTLIVPKKMEYVRIYGESPEKDILAAELRSMGFTKSTSAMDGIRLNPIPELHTSHPVVPYIDGHGRINLIHVKYDDGSRFLTAKIDPHGDYNTQDGTHYERCASSKIEDDEDIVCDECGYRFHEESEYRVHIDGYDYCSSRCAYNAGFVYTEDHEWERKDDCFEIDGCWFHKRNLTFHDICKCDHCGDYHFREIVSSDGEHFCDDLCADLAGYTKINDIYHPTNQVTTCNECGDKLLKEYVVSQDELEFCSTDCLKENQLSIAA